MAAKVVAELELNSEKFREGIRHAQTGFAKFRTQAQLEGSKIAKSIKPVAIALTAIGAAAAAAGAAFSLTVGSMVKDGIALNSELEQAKIRFTAFTKDAKLAGQIVADLKKEADITPFGTQEIITSGAALISSAKGSREELMKLIKTSEILAALNPAQGLDGAAYALREAVGGDYKSVQTRFDISRGLINELKSQGLEGLALVNAALKRIGAGPELVTGLANSFEGLKSTAGSFFDNFKQTLSEPVFNQLKIELQDFVTYIGGPAGDAVTDFGKNLGEHLGTEAAKLFDSIKQVDWADVAQSAKDISDALVSAAKSGADLAVTLPAKISKSKNFLNKVNVVSGNISTGLDLGASAFAEGVGATGVAGYFRNSVRDTQASMAESRQQIAQYEASQRQKANGPVASRSEQLAAQNRAASEFARNLGLTANGQAVRAPANRAPLPVDIMLGERNQAHSVMAT